MILYDYILSACFGIFACSLALTFLYSICPFCDIFCLFSLWINLIACKLFDVGKHAYVFALENYLNK